MEPGILSVVDIYERALTSFRNGDVKNTISAINLLFDCEQKNQTLSSLTRFFSCCKDLKSNKSLALLAAKELDKWYAGCKDDTEVPEDLKTDLMPVVIVSHSATTSILIRIYELNKAPNGFLKPYIMDLIAHERLKEATSITCKLGMQEHFDLYDLVLPMLTQNKVNLVEEYLMGSKTLQLEMISLLDSWIQSDFDLIAFLKEKDIHEVRGEILRPKFLMKLLTRWLKVFFKINDLYSGEGQKLCPNLCKRKALNNLKYLLYRHYVEELSTVETTQELILKAVGKDKYLQEQLVDILGTVYGDWESAKQWAKLYNVQHESLDIPNNLESATNEMKLSETEEWDCESWSSNCFVSKKSPTDYHNWYGLNLSSDKVIFVNSCDSLNDCEQYIMSFEVVGIDSEWVPSFAASGTVSVALLQIATLDNVFLIDVAYFCNSASANVEAFCAFVSKLLSAKHVLKIGYGISEDIRKLSDAFPSIASTLKNPARVTDLCASVRALERHYPKIFDFPDEALNDVEVDMPSSKKETGLSKLTHRCFGRPLNKNEQMSDWERRPLRESQITYAALDAFVLIELYNFIHKKMKLEGIEHTLETIISVKNSRKKSKIKTKDQVPTCDAQTSRSSPSHDKNSCVSERPQITPYEFKVVCDNMLQGLGRQLRCCGVDVKILTNLDDHERAAEVANEDGRILLTCGAPYQYLASQVPVGECFNVPCGEKAKDQAAIVLERFNVKVTAKDIFSRCQICNGNRYLKVMPDVMKRCVKRKQELLQEQNFFTKVGAGISFDEIKPTKSVGRGKHFSDKASQDSNTSPVSIKQFGSTGRGRAMRELGIANSPLQTSSVDSFSSNSRDGLRSFDEIASDSDDDVNDILFFTKGSPRETPANVEYAPIRSSDVNCTNIADTKGEILDNTMDLHKFISAVDGGKVVASDTPMVVESETCIGIAKNNPTDKLTETSEKNASDCMHSGGKDKVIPYIINPRSLCTLGFVNVKNVTIVSPTDGNGNMLDDGSSPTDALVTPLLCEQIPTPMLNRVKVFYCCVKCGKVFWEGRHFTAVLEQFSHVICDE